MGVNRRHYDDTGLLHVLTIDDYDGTAGNSLR